MFRRKSTARRCCSAGSTARSRSRSGTAATKGSPIGARSARPSVQACSRRPVALAKTLFWLALAVWLGEIVFFSFVVAPSVFGVVPEVAGQVVGAIFPRYYALGAGAGVIALVAAVALRGATSATRSWSAIVAMLVVMLVATLYAGRVIEPR
ncbi:MAG: DUF4149 domain-containing protein, partial [Deltaproteobacteria bacterium]